MLHRLHRRLADLNHRMLVLGYRLSPDQVDAGIGACGFPHFERRLADLDRGMLELGNEMFPGLDI